MRKACLIIVLFAFAVTGAALWWVKRHGGLRTIIVEKTTDVVLNQLPPQERSVVEEALGFYEPQTYLVLFLNNTELRPGGGFIGAYAVVTINKGQPEIVKVEGTEILDNRAPQDFPSPLPEPLQKYLPGVTRWAFRDSNWLPDFASSSIKSLDLYIKERGVMAHEIDGVIGITPTVLEELLRITGPITVNDVMFTPENAVERLEYEVEFGYAEDGLHFDERKKMLVDLTHVMFNRLKKDIFRDWQQYLALADRLLQEKHVIAYAVRPQHQQALVQQGWAGLVDSKTTGDYILWVDANLAALKTDRAMQRELSYTFSPASGGRYLATVTMKYRHTGKFDKFTTRYRTYARLYVPQGSTFVRVKGSLKSDRSNQPGTVDQGVELGKQWFGTFISIEPGQTKELQWQFHLAPSVVEQIKNGAYTLIVQKQAGTINHALTLGLDFGTSITAASPAEAQKDFGDGTYRYQGDLRVDREFTVTLQ